MNPLSLAVTVVAVFMFLCWLDCSLHEFFLV